MSDDAEHPTDAMIQAGIVALLACEIGSATEGEIVSRVYRAMRRAAHGEPPRELSSDPADAAS